MSNLLTQWARLLACSLADAGATEVVVSPGSRNSPFVIGAIGEPRLRCHDIVDERSAAFFALGQAKATGRPSVLLCTSGSAGAHYMPAVVEAAMSNVPLLILTADRPFELQACNSNQAVDQVKMYGDFTRQYFDLGMPDESAAALRALRRIIAQAMFISKWPNPGPVHINIRARKPLEPVGADSDPARELEGRVSALARQPIVETCAPRLLPDGEAVAAVAKACRESERGLIVCGPGPAAQADAREGILALAAATGFPVYAEAASQLRFGLRPSGDVTVCDGLVMACGSPRFREMAPDLVLQFGAPLTSGNWESFLERNPECRRIVIAPHGWNDPASSASMLVVSGVRDAAGEIAKALGSRSASPPGDRWAKRLAAMNAVVWQAVEAVLSETSTFAEPLAVHTVVSQIPRSSVLAIGNSLAIRELDTFCRGDLADVIAISQRGASGIDGLISAASGVASTQSAPVTLLIGDVSCLHDVGGLATARNAGVPLVIVVLQNFGGRIFELLPIFESAVGPSVMDHMVTPHRYTFESAAKLFEHSYERALSAAQLRAALTRAYDTKGCTVIEAVLPEHSARESMQKLRQTIDRGMSSLSLD